MHSLSPCSRLSLLVLALLPLQGLQAQEAQRSPDAKGLRPLSGFQVKAIASGAHLAGASDLAFDAQGRPWVLVAGERILELDPRVGGQRLVHEGLQGASAMLLLAEGLLLADANGFLHLPQVAGESVRLWEGLAESGLRVEDLVWSLDGWVYAALSGEGDWFPEAELPLRPGVIRLRPDGSLIEQVSHVPAGAASVDVSWEGELFFSTSSGQAAHVVLPDSSFSGGLSGSLAGWKTLAVRPASSVHAYGGGAWPAEYENSLILCNAETGRLNRAGTLSGHSSPIALQSGNSLFLSSVEPGFHPVALSGGPEGALYVLDARPGEGFLWRVQYASRVSQPALPAWDPKRLEALLPELAHPNLWHRLHVQRVLQAAGLDSAASMELARLARNSESPWIQLHALWLNAGGAAYLSWCLDNYVAGVRRNALAVVKECFDEGRSRIPPGSITALVRDGDARVRLQALQAWRPSLGASSMPELIELYPGLWDEYGRALALEIAATHPVATQNAIFRSPDSAVCRELLGAVARRVASEGGGRDALGLLFGLSASGATPTLQADVLSALHRHGRGRTQPWPSPRLSATLRRFGDASDPRVAFAALPLAHAWCAEQISSSKYASWMQRAVETLEGDGASLESRVAATCALLAYPEGRTRGISFAGILLEQDLGEPEERSLVIELGALDEAPAGAVLVRALPSLRASARVRAQASIFERAAWLELLFGALESGALPLDSLDASWHAALRKLEDEALRARAERLLGAATPATLKPTE